MNKPDDARGYQPEWVDNARAACLYVATILGDMLVDDLVVVGGLVPSILIAQDPPLDGVPPHPGTMDLDLGLKLAVLDDKRYSEIARRLREAQFEVDENAAGKPTLQRWRVKGNQGQVVTVDFLIAPSSETEQPSGIKHLEKDFGAVVTPGLELAFVDREMVRMTGDTIMSEHVSREIPVCGPGAFVALKALAFRARGGRKDAYDLYYVVRNLEGGIPEIVGRMSHLRPDPAIEDAIEVLRNNFTDPGQTGPIRAAAFAGDEALRQDVVGFVSDLLRAIDDEATS